MKLKMLCTVLLSVALIWSIQQETPVHKSFADTAKAKPVQVVAPEKATEATQTPTEQEATNEPATPQVETPVAQPPLTSNEELMSQAGIDQNDWAAVDYIVSHESGWRTSAVNPSSGSCGLVQELPCGKSGCTLGDGVCQLRWASQYATQRYGSWWGAQTFWQAHRWW